MTTITRFDIDRPEAQDHARPCIVEIATPREGALRVHCSREDGSLWLFAVGPAGGDRGSVALAVERAGRVLEWLDGRGARWLTSGVGSVSFGGDRIAVSSPGRRDWAASLGEDAADELRACLREWATAMKGA